MASGRRSISVSSTEVTICGDTRAPASANPPAHPISVSRYEEERKVLGSKDAASGAWRSATGRYATDDDSMPKTIQYEVLCGAMCGTVTPAPLLQVRNSCWKELNTIPKRESVPYAQIALRRVVLAFELSYDRGNGRPTTMMKFLGIIASASGTSGRFKNTMSFIPLVADVNSPLYNVSHAMEPLDRSAYQGVQCLWKRSARKDMCPSVASLQSLYPPAAQGLIETVIEDVVLASILEAVDRRDMTSTKLVVRMRC